MGKAGGVGKRGVGSSKSKKTHKAALRNGFELRHIDQVRERGRWERESEMESEWPSAAASAKCTSRCASSLSVSVRLSSFHSAESKRLSSSLELAKEKPKKVP